METAKFILNFIAGIALGFGAAELARHGVVVTAIVPLYVAMFTLLMRLALPDKP